MGGASLKNSQRPDFLWAVAVEAPTGTPKIDTRPAGRTRRDLPTAGGSNVRADTPSSRPAGRTPTKGRTSLYASIR